MQQLVRCVAHVLWAKCRIIESRFCPEAAPDLSRLSKRPVAVSLPGGGMHQPRAGTAQEARLCPVQMQGAASAPGAEEIRLVLAEGFWDAGQDDRLLDRLPFAAARPEIEVQSDLILSTVDPDPVRRLAVVSAPAPAPAPAFTEDAGLRHSVCGELAMRLHNASPPRIVTAAA